VVKVTYALDLLLELGLLLRAALLVDLLDNGFGLLEALGAV
jgi:hypothetical protein